MTIAGVQLAEISETCAYRDIIAIGRQEGLEDGRPEGKRRKRQPWY